MLCQFSFSNFKSYRDATTFDFQASNIAEFKDSLIVNDHASALLPVSAIYGPNGGGKSNLLAALGCVVSAIVNPVVGLEKTRKKFVIQQNVDLVPFLFDEVSKKEPTEFLLFFRIAKNEYKYFLAFQEGEIIIESLQKKTIGAKKPASLFMRDKEKIKVGSGLGVNGINTNVNPKMPFLSFLAINYSIPIIDEVMEWFESIIIRNYGNPITETRVLLDRDEASKEKFLGMMNEMGINVSGYRYDQDQKEFFLQRTLGNRVFELPFYSESDGTKKLFAALPVLLLALNEGRLVLVDELDAKLHPKLLRYVIKLFTNPASNPKGAQLLFTSHDMSTMKNTVFRRDEIWFAAMNDENSSEVYSLYDIRKEDNEHVNNTASYDKQYLEGRYGADPYLKNMLNWGEAE